MWISAPLFDCYNIECPWLNNDYGGCWCFESLSLLMFFLFLHSFAFDYSHRMSTILVYFGLFGMHALLDVICIKNDNGQ